MTSSPATSHIAEPGNLKSDDALAAILKSKSIGLLVHDADAKVIEISAGLCQLIGYTVNELIGTDGSLILHPDERATAKLNLLALDNDRKSARAVERRLIHKDGSIVWALFSISRVTDITETGGPVYLSQVTPIGKQKSAEKAAEEALHRWTFALENAGQGTWDYDIVNDKWTFSKAWKLMRGFHEDDPPEFVNHGWLDTIHPEDRDRVASLFARQSSGELDEVDYEYRLRRCDGEWIWIMVRGRCIDRDKNGSPRYIIGTDTDITELKRREQTYFELSERLELALSTSRIGVWETDLESLHPTWDARTCEIFGCSPQYFENPAEAWPSLIHPDDRERAVAIAEAAVATRTDYECEYRVVRPDGEIRQVRSRASFSLVDGGVWKMIGINWDITEDVARAEALDRAKRLAEERNGELEAARAAMEHASLHDALTGLANRRYLDKLLESLSDADETCRDLTILHVDLDRFKQINDTRGHAAGDTLLVHMAGMLSAIVGPRNTVARIGGDEFVVVLSPSPSAEQLRGMIEEIIHRSNVPIYWHGQECRTSASVGVAIADGKTCPRQLLINADLALYRAKNLGRNQASFFDAQMQSEIISQKQCGDDILKGIAQGNFFPFYQPQFCARTLDIIGVEALARWRHPVEGLLSPDRFLGTASEINVMQEIDRAILETALRDLKRWDQAGAHIPKVSVNVSANRLAEKGLIETISRNDWARSRITIELLESIFLDESDPVYDKHIARLKQLGVDIAIDDFGTGHASIIGMLKLNPHRLKIDRQLIAPIADSSPQRGLIKSIIDIGKSQGIQVCAEGVETHAQVDILRDLGCDCLQGYYFGRPMSASDLLTFVRDEQWRPGRREPQPASLGRTA